MSTESFWRCREQQQQRQQQQQQWMRPKSVIVITLAGVLGLGSVLKIRGLGSGTTASKDNPPTFKAYVFDAIHRPVNSTDSVGSDLCKTPYITKDADILKAMEAKQMAWLHNLLSVSKARQAHPGRGWNMFNDTMMPVLQGLCAVERVGSEGDGGKFLCGLDHLAGRKDCVVYSIGSNNQWDFEEAIVARTGCHVDTFDCTVQHASIPSAILDHVHFEPLCLGTAAGGYPGAKLLRATGDTSKESDLSTMMKLRNTSDISLLKMDIEGAEWNAFRAILGGECDELPEQISVEFHFVVDPQEVAIFAQQLHMAGYRVVSKEDNVRCESCTEFTLARVYCPRTGALEPHLRI